MTKMSNFRLHNACNKKRHASYQLRNSVNYLKVRMKEKYFVKAALTLNHGPE